MSPMGDWSWGIIDEFLRELPKPQRYLKWLY